jgi:hypothetical protein
MNGCVFNLDSHCRVIRVFPTKKKPDVFQAILQIDRLAYETVMKRGGLVGYAHCVVYDALEVSRCFNCNDFNHSSRSCSNVRSCLRCSLDHDVKSCESETLKCINCVRLNKSKNLNLDVAHAAWNTGCSAYFHKQAKARHPRCLIAIISRVLLDSCGNPLSCLNNWNCYYSNLNSLLAKFNELLTSVISGSPHIFLVTETWLSEYHDDSLVNLPGYTVYRRYRVGSRGRGVCVYLMDSVFYQFKVNILPCTFHSSEGIFLLITLHNFSFVVGCVYRPPNSLTECDHEIFLFLTNLFLKYKHVIVAGDFNFPNLTWPLCFDSRFSSADALLVDFLLNTHATQFVQECTRFRSG